MLLITRNRDTFELIKEKGFAAILVPGLNLSRSGQIKIAVLLGLSKNLLQRGDRLLCLTGVAEKRNLDTTIFLEVGEEYEMFSGGRWGQLSSSATRKRCSNCSLGVIFGGCGSTSSAGAKHCLANRSPSQLPPRSRRSAGYS